MINTFKIEVIVQDFKQLRNWTPLSMCRFPPVNEDTFHADINLILFSKLCQFYFMQNILKWINVLFVLLAK